MKKNDCKDVCISSETNFKTATDLEVLRRSHAFLIKIIAGVSIAAIMGLVSVVYIMQAGQAKVVASYVSIMAKTLK